MRRFLTLLICFSMLFTFVACNADIPSGEPSGTTSELLDSVATTAATTAGSGEATNKCDFYAGYARADITPTKFPVYLTGGTSATSVLEKIYGTCVAFSDNETTVLFITLDISNITGEFYNKAVYNINKATGIDKKNIFVSATHNHSAPHVSQSKSGDYTEEWRTALNETLVDISKEAIADLKPTEAYYGKTNTEGLAFVRRYLLADGTYRSIGLKYSWSSNAKEVAHESEADSELQVLRFTREGAKDIVMANWQAHAAHAYSNNPRAICGDFIYYFRQVVEQNDDDVLVAYFQGASGNINLSSYVNNVSGQYPKVGKALGAYCNDLLPKLERLTLDKIKVLKTTIKLGIGNDSDERVQAAIDIREGRDTNNAIRNKYKLEEHEPNAIYTRYLLRRANPSGFYNISLFAISFGDMSFVSTPCEMFDTNGMEVKTASQFKSTFVCAYTNGSEGYVPSAAAIPHGGYEVYSCKFEAGSGEKLSSTMTDMLKKLYEN